MQFLQNARVRIEERGNRERRERTILIKIGYWSIKLWHEKHGSHRHSLFVLFRAMDSALCQYDVLVLKERRRREF